MKNFSSLFLLIALTLLSCKAFCEDFQSGSLRIDYYRCGNQHNSYYQFDKFIIEKYWGGSRNHNIDVFNYGVNMVKVYDIATNKLIYSRGYCSLFQEWQTTEEAATVNRCYEESVSIPNPKSSVKIIIEERNNQGFFEEKIIITYEPDNMFVVNKPKYSFPVYDALINGDPSNKVDIVIIPDGYKQEEMNKFIGDCNTFVEILKKFEPFRSHINDFNVRGVLAPSDDSGVDIPGEGIWKNTILNCHFYTFGTDRYCTTEDYFAVKDVAACVPYDQIYILVNSEIYGGGGIYNYYSVSTSGNMSSDKVIIHEFGHAFAGLADEYYDSNVAYSDTYPFGLEPWEFNITTLVNFDSKWNFMLDKNVPIPTPLEDKYINTIGVFEGAGYSSVGIYRPAYDCMMKTFKDDRFCAVCTYAIERMIESHK